MSAMASSSAASATAGDWPPYNGPWFPPPLWSPVPMPQMGQWVFVPYARITGCICPQPGPFGRYQTFGIACPAHVTC